MAKKVQSRGLTRRLTQIFLSVSALTGSGWGIYQFQAGDEMPQASASEGQTRIGQTAEKKSSGPSSRLGRSAADELKDLFSSESTPGAKPSVQNASVAADPPGDPGVVSNARAKPRYARYSAAGQHPASPPPVVQLPPSSKNNPFSAIPPVMATAGQPPAPQPKSAPLPPMPGDRYAAAASLLHVSSPDTDPVPAAALAPEPAPTSPTEPPLASSSSAPGWPEAARGQGPENPLRAKVPLPAAAPFAEKNQPRAGALKSPSAGPLAHTPLTNSGQGKPIISSPEEVNATLSRARPLMPAALPADQHVPSVASLNPARRNPAPVRKPAAPFAIDAGTLGSSSLKTPAAPKSISSPIPEKHSGSGQSRSESPTPTPGLVSREGTGRPGEQLFEGTQNPSITIEKLAPPEIQVGKKCTFAIRVQNIGQRAAQNVIIRDEVPLGTQLLGTAPRAVVHGANLLWDLGTLSVGEERTVEMELIPTEEGELGSVAMVTFATQASAKARSTRPELALQLTCAKPKVLAGAQQQVHIEVSNPGSGDATGVILLDTLPAGVSHPAGPALELEIGTLPAGQSRAFDLVLGAEQAGPIENVMTARADANLQVQASCKFEVIAPQLHVDVKGPEKRFLERPATYQVRVENPGTAPAREVQLVTHLPKGLQFVKANNMGEYHADTHSIHWSLTELPANQQGTVELVALPVEAGDQSLQIDTRADQGLEDHTEKRIHVEGLAALMFEVVDTEDPIEVGGETYYEIRVTNQGSKSAANVQVVARMPAGIRAVSAEGDTGHTIQGERVEFAPLARLDPKAVVIYRIGAEGLQPGHQRVRVQITTDEIQQPITKEESTRVYSDQ